MIQIVASAGSGATDADANADADADADVAVVAAIHANNISLLVGISSMLLKS